MKLSYEDLEILVKRNYPDYPDLKPTGMCSKHHSNEIDVKCSVCFPNWLELTNEHCRLKLKAWKRLTELGEKIDYGY